MATPKVLGINEVIRELQSVEPQSVKEIRTDLRVAAEPLAASIRDYIPNSPPLSGFVHNGRTSWAPQNIKINVKTNFSRRAAKNEHSIVSIWVGGKKGTLGAAGLQIADMAGKRNRTRSGGRTREYDYRGSKRTHRLNNQGRAMIEYLNGSYSSPSRFVWRAANLQLPKVQESVVRSLESVYKKVNQNMMVKK